MRPRGKPDPERLILNLRLKDLNRLIAHRHGGDAPTYSVRGETVCARYSARAVPLNFSPVRMSAWVKSRHSGTSEQCPLYRCIWNKLLPHNTFFHFRFADS